MKRVLGIFAVILICFALGLSLALGIAGVGTGTLAVGAFSALAVV